MPIQTVLVLHYNAYSTIKLPKEHAAKLKSGEWSFWIKWGTIHYKDNNGVEHEIEGCEPEVSCKYPESYTFELYDEERETQELYEKNKKAAALATIAAAKRKITSPDVTVSGIKITDSDSGTDAIYNTEKQKDGIVHC